jgi:putative DNA methylase
VSDTQAPIKRKLIEVALPLEAINRESAREKSIRHGHPSTLHLWWARRPLAACRAVLFAQLVDDPSAHPDRFGTEQAQAKERRRLFDLIERLVKWENTNDEGLLRQAYEEIARCFDGKPPAILDPFAGGGSIPLEAQRLGLEAHASDLNPVAVLINKALIEIPPKFAGRPPVFPGAAETRMGEWPRATGLAEDVRRYGEWMRDEAEKRIGHHYPKAKLPDGGEANVIAWIWARTVTCPNPACGIRMPLVRSWWLGKKKGKEAYVVPRVVNGLVEFSIGHDPKTAPTKDNDGTVTRTGAICVACNTPAPLSYVRAEGKAKRMGAQLMSIAAEGNRRRVYLPPTPEHEQAADVSIPDDVPDTELPEAALGFRVQGYGMTRHADLFTPRQLTALTTFSDLVMKAHARVLADAIAAGQDAGEPLEAGGTEAVAYADAVSTYLGLAMSRYANFMNVLCQWRPDAGKEQVGHLFTRQAIPMAWDAAESNPWSSAAGCWDQNLLFLPKVLDRLEAWCPGVATQAGAASRSYGGKALSTDPPYYDNVGYADLSDFFYIWLRHSVGGVHRSLLSTLLTPKGDELVADPFRRGGREEAERYFEEGFAEVFGRVRGGTPDDVPTTVFYAFKQAETGEGGTASTGWEVLLEGMIRSGWEITATWPIRTELSNRMRSLGSNALASSVVLACRPRPENAGSITRRGFLGALKDEMPKALKELQQGSIPPVDLAQAAIGPGMAVFSRYATVVEPDGSDMTVRTALTLINAALDEVLSEQEGDFDTDTRFCVRWFRQFGWDEQLYGRADELSRAVNTSVDGLVRGGVFWARAGRARLVEPGDLSGGWDPETDERISVWEVVLRLAKALSETGVDEAARLMAASGGRVDLDAAKELAYLLFSICERRGWTQTALLFNGLGTSWSDLSAISRAGGALTPPPVQDELDYGTGEE